MFTHPSVSYLIFEGLLTKADGTLYLNADEVALTNNAIMHLFSRIEYHLSNQLIESLNYPGQAITMLGLLKYSDDFSKAQGLNQLWYKDTATTAKADNNGFAARHAYLIQSPTVKGTFSFRSIMKHIFGFCEDYDKIVYFLKHNLTLIMKTDDDAIVRRNATHCISPYAIVVCVCVCLSVCMTRFWTSGKWFEIETPFLFYFARNDTGHNL